MAAGRDTLRVGLAYNLKPAVVAGSPEGLVPSGDAASAFPVAAAAMAGEARALAAPPVAASMAFAEWDAPETIGAVEHALRAAGEVVHLHADESLPTALLENPPDVVFNLAEGRGGRCREAHVPAMLEYLEIPYTGSDPLTLALTLDKAMTKRVLEAAGVPTPAFRVLGEDAGGSEARASVDEVAAVLGLPLIVKPLHEGSSIGIGDASLCADGPSLRRAVEEIREGLGQPALVERFLPGREFTCALLGNGSALRTLPLVEIDFAALPAGANPIYGYEAKWVWDRPQEPLRIFHCPAEVESGLARRLEETARAAFRALGCRDWARVDLRLDESGRPMVLEINALPGVLPDPEQNSCFPKAARAAGMEYDEMILAVLGAARERCGV